jgi:hypothetical protein
LFPASEEERGALLLDFFLFVRQKEIEDERKSGTLFQKVASHRHLLRPRLAGERERQAGDQGFIYRVEEFSR